MGLRKAFFPTESAALSFSGPRADGCVSHRGQLVALLLGGAWRRHPPPPSLPEDALAGVVPLLLATGSGALVWWKLRHSDLRNSPAAWHLHQAYRKHTLEAALQERGLLGAIRRFRSVGVEPVLAKGWAAARLYPEQGLRPYGDIDLWVRPEDFERAESALRRPAQLGAAVDLHGAFRDLDRGWDEVYRRSRLLTVNDVAVRILGREDHLRLLCRHFFYHGGWRPLWLCDIAAMLESLPADFDWEYCLGGNTRPSDWIACALGLAQQLLGARLEGSGFTPRGKAVPGWLIPSVVRQWGTRGYYMNSPSMAFSLRHPGHLLQALFLRWPNPIQATVRLGGPFNEMPRLPFQLAECVRRTVRFVRPRGSNGI